MFGNYLLRGPLFAYSSVFFMNWKVEPLKVQVTEVLNHRVPPNYFNSFFESASRRADSVFV